MLRGSVSARRGADVGFTLIEMVVALAVLGLAAMALVRLLGLTLGSTAALADRAMGQVVVNNLAVDLLTARAGPSIGRVEGQTDNAGTQWRWRREVRRTDDPRFVRVDLIVFDAQGRRAAALSLARGA